MSQETEKKWQLDPPDLPKWRILPFFQYFSLDVFSPELKRSPFTFWYLQYLKAAPDSAAEFLIERWLDLLYQIALMEYLLRKVGTNRGPHFYKIRQYWQGQPHWIATPEESWGIAVNYLHLLCITFKIPEPIWDQPLQLFSQAKILLNEHCIEALITAAFYLSCKTSHIPPIMAELIYTPLLKEDVWLCYRQLLAMVD